MQNKPINGLYGLFLKRLNEVSEDSRKDIIPFPDIFEKLCPNFSMTKQQCWEILFLFNDLGFIEIVTQHGIKVNTTNILSN